MLPLLVADLTWSIGGTGDFNADDDILWRNNSGTGDNRVWLMDGTNQAEHVATTPVADLNWSISGTGDLTLMTRLTFSGATVPQCQ